jgi:pantetheine-phosphate adenylyltransferase
MDSFNMNKKQHAIYAGTFDPFTNGHYDVVKRALTVFDQVTILLAVPPSKEPLLSRALRLKMLEELFADESAVSVDHWDGLVVDYAKNNNIGAIVRGLRPTGDFDIEFQMASMNKKLYEDIETLFLMTNGDYYFLSSTLVREILQHGGDASPFVPPTILKYL